jgi:hypothetical protein
MPDVFSFLVDLGYTGHLLHGDALLPVSRFDPEIHQSNDGDRFWDAPNYFNNFLFTVASLPKNLRAVPDPATTR